MIDRAAPRRNGGALVSLALFVATASFPGSVSARALGMVPHGTGAAPISGPYSGKTAAGSPIRFRFTVDGRISALTIEFRTRCGGKQHKTKKSAPLGVLVGMTGTFRYAAGGLTFSGRVSGKSAAGTFRLSRGGCDSGVIHWTATSSAPAGGGDSGTGTGEPHSRPVVPGHYGGLTSQGLDVSFDVATDLTQVSVLSIDLTATCDSGRTTLLSATAIDVSAQIGTDLSFSYTASQLVVTGTLDRQGGAKGTAKATASTPLGTCTADVTWTIPDGSPSNRPPTFPSNSTSSTTAYDYDSDGHLVNATTTISITPATDPDNDPLIYSWSLTLTDFTVPTAGTITGNGPSATWDRIVSLGRVVVADIVVTVRDGRGGIATFTIHVVNTP